MPGPTWAPSTGGTTGTSVAERPPANPGSGPVTGRAPQTPGVSTTPAGAGPARPEGGEKLPEPAKTPRSAALLLLFDAFQNVRALSEEEYLAGRDGLASNLLANLEPFMQEARSTGEAAGTPQPPRPPLIEVVPREPAITPPKPPVLPPKPPTPVVTPGVPRIPSVPSAPTVPAGGGAVKPAPTAPAAGSSTNRVPQKQRIGRKFAAAEQPFLALKTNNDPKAEEAATLLADSRKAFAAGDFDTSEAKVDEALRLMGVPIPQ